LFTAVGVYRLWRDLGYAIGALLSGLIADALGIPAAIGNEFWQKRNIQSESKQIRQ